MIPLFIQALSGLDYIHRNGIIHLDIKSENMTTRLNRGEIKPHAIFTPKINIT